MVFIKEDNEFKVSQDEDISFEKEAFKDERELQKLIFDHPYILEDDTDVSYYSVDMEVRLPKSNNRIDNLLIDNNGNVILVEDKLSKNPDKRHAVSQISEYIVDLKGYGIFDLNKITGRKLMKKVKDIEEKSGREIQENIDTSVRLGRIKQIIAIDGVDEVNDELLKRVEMIKVNNPDARLFVIEKYDNGNMIKVTNAISDPIKPPLMSDPQKGEHQGKTSAANTERDNRYFEKLKAVSDFLKDDFPTREPRLGDNAMICRDLKNGVFFYISYTDGSEYQFSWQTRVRDNNTIARFKENETAIKNLYPDANLENRAASRFKIPIDNDKPRESILKVIEDTRIIIGWTG
jgi:hypothetical protein